MGCAERKYNTVGRAVNQRGCKINTRGGKEAVGVLCLCNQFIKRDTFERVRLGASPKRAASIYVVYVVNLQVEPANDGPFIVQRAAVAAQPSSSSSKMQRLGEERG